MGTRRKLGAVLLLLGAVVSGGCGSADSKSTTKGTVSSGKRFILLTNGNSPFWDACRFGLQEGAKEFKLGEAGLHSLADRQAAPVRQPERHRRRGRFGPR